MPGACCRHFGACGGCAWQGLAPETYRERKRCLIVEALARHGISAPALKEIATVPPRSRRRASLKIDKSGGQTRIGFHARRSHNVVDIRECQVLTPGLFALAQHLRETFSQLLREGESAEVYVVEAENGFDLAIAWSRKTNPDLVAQIAAAAPKLNLIRVTIGSELLYENAVPVVRFGSTPVKLPPNAFLQSTRQGESVLQDNATKAVGTARTIVDLFCGCGTFALKLAERATVHAVDNESSMLAALSDSVRNTSGLKPVTTERRDLFKHPLAPAELNRFEAVVLDPPRAGALAQVKQVSQSRLSRIAYVSCDAASFARDARILIDGGFRLDWIVGVDQFLWSAHIELTAAFTRD